MRITHAFTCTGPYAILIMLGIKRVENRSVMPPGGCGRCAVSCSKSFCREEYGNFVRWASRVLPSGDFDGIPAWTDVQDWPGRIVGTCTCVGRGRNDLRLSAEEDVGGCGAGLSWDEGYPYWWDLSEVACLDCPIVCRGNVGMWQLPRELVPSVTQADELARSVGVTIACADDARRIFRAALPLVGANEGFFVLPLDAQNRTLAAPTLVSLGTTEATVVRPRDVFRSALSKGADAIIVAHNHPSGNVAFSPQDRHLTETLKGLGESLGIRILDHLVLVK